MHQIRQHAEPDARSVKRSQVCDAEKHAEAETMKLLKSRGSTRQEQLTSCLLGRNERDYVFIKNW